MTRREFIELHMLAEVTNGGAIDPAASFARAVAKWDFIQSQFEKGNETDTPEDSDG